MASSATTGTETEKNNPGAFNTASGAAAASEAATPVGESNSMPKEQKDLKSSFNTQNEINKVLDDLSPKKKHKDGHLTIKDVDETLNGLKVWTNEPQISIGDAFSRFFSLLMKLFSGDWEGFQLELDGPGGFKDTYIDPIEEGVSTLPKAEQDKVVELGKTIERARLTLSPNMTGFERLQALSQDAGIQQILGIIVKYETKEGGDFDMANGGSRPLINGKPASQATIAEVLKAQENHRQWPGAASSAIGAFQIIRSTLSGAVKNLGLDPETTLFDQQTQTLIALHLIDKGVGDYEKSGDKAKLIKVVGKIWSSLPVDETGKAAHGHLANNPLSVPVSRHGEMSRAVDLIGTPAPSIILKS